jgi:hypothetical protein
MSPTARRQDPTATSTTAAGLEDVTRSLRVLTRNGRELVTDGGLVLERELAMAITLSERLRDDAFSADALERARKGRLNSTLRADAHRIVDLVADVSGVAASSAVRFAEQFADAPRPSLATEESADGVAAASA